MKSNDGERITVLCSWCRAEITLRPGDLRHRIKDANHVACSNQCSQRYRNWLADKEQYGPRPVSCPVFNSGERNAISCK